MNLKHIYHAKLMHAFVDSVKSSLIIWGTKMHRLEIDFVSNFFSNYNSSSVAYNVVQAEDQVTLWFSSRIMGC